MNNNSARIKILLVGLILHLALFSVEAQKNYEEAYLVLTAGDTLHGYVDNKDWSVSPQSIEFKKDLSGSADTYSTINVHSFFLKKSKKLYFGASVTIDKSPITLSEIKEAGSEKYSEETIFLQVLVRGTLSLYSSFDFKPHYYVQRENGVIQELIMQHRVVTDANNQSSVTRFKKYRLQLNSMLSDCSEILPKIEKTEFNEKALKALIAGYNKCKGDGSQYVEVKIKEKAEFGLLVGLSKTNFDIRSNELFAAYLAKNPYDGDLTPLGGFYVNFGLRGKRKALFLHNELSYTYFSVKSTYVEHFAPYDQVYTNHTNLGFIKYNVGPMYRLSFKTIKPFINGGFAAYFAIKEDIYTLKERVSGGVVQASSKITYDPRKYQLAIWLGAGISVKEFALEVRLERPNGWSKVSGYEVVTNHFNAMLSYRLN